MSKYGFESNEAKASRILKEGHEYSTRVSPFIEDIMTDYCLHVLNAKGTVSKSLASKVDLPNSVICGWSYKVPKVLGVLLHINLMQYRAKSFYFHLGSSHYTGEFAIVDLEVEKLARLISEKLEIKVKAIYNDKQLKIIRTWVGGHELEPTYQ